MTLGSRVNQLLCYFYLGIIVQLVKLELELLFKICVSRLILLVLFGIVDSLVVDSDLLIEPARHCAGQAEVTEAYAAIICEQNVARFQVPMHNVGGLQEMNGAKNVVEYYFDVLHIERGWLNFIEDLF